MVLIPATQELKTGSNAMPEEGGEEIPFDF